jgi:hypothetical protein
MSIIHGTEYRAVAYWRRLFLEGSIDLAEFERRLEPAIEYDDRRDLMPDPEPDGPDPGKRQM